MERFVLFGLSILNGNNSGRFHRRARSLGLRGTVLNSGSNDIPGLDGVEHALVDLLGVNLDDTRNGEGEVTNREDGGGVVGFCKSGSLGCQIEMARER
ncbi:WPP domain-containing protein 2-like [Pyrus ussuriensis x Pyrus communis]|uniref:WPP domain-containing protein 2-like n=1 Tax=Pyrus ussuriensis x Pyrus communis TaxID=2448454 RepID=A0A5N5EY16_9ROSA|nr:WPP domain-containing protein 2-like [Pyrus ussuriensis x Pyrus communis]